MRVDFFAWSNHEGKAMKPFFSRHNWPSDTPEIGWNVTFVIAQGNTESLKFGEVVDVQEAQECVSVWMDMGEEFIQNLHSGLVKVINWRAMARPEKTDIRQ